MHTFIRAREMSEEKAFKTICQRLRYLTRKLIEDLELGEKIFVYKKRGDPITEEEIANLREAFHRNFPLAVLLIVKVADGTHPPGKVELKGDLGLLGYIDRFCDLSHQYISYKCWEEICRNAKKLVRRM